MTLLYRHGITDTITIVVTIVVTTVATRHGITDIVTTVITIVVTTLATYYRITTHAIFVFTDGVRCRASFFLITLILPKGCRLICPVRSPTNILQCFQSGLLMNWTYLSVGPSKYGWLVPYFQTSHLVCFLFSIQFLILNLNLPHWETG